MVACRVINAVDWVLLLLFTVLDVACFAAKSFWVCKRTAAVAARVAAKRAADAAALADAAAKAVSLWSALPDKGRTIVAGCALMVKAGVRVKELVANGKVVGAAMATWDRPA